mmetsp:Transcript_28836/g.32393  ORF Transcript_28836/g.32393 Transcript_28836/m.32393 type:complete len:95 (+) Transcript_28836:2-286(+)
MDVGADTNMAIHNSSEHVGYADGWTNVYSTGGAATGDLAGYVNDLGVFKNVTNTDTTDLESIDQESSGGGTTSATATVVTSFVASGAIAFLFYF